MTDLKGKRALITGASRGIGREISTALAALGCNLVLHSRSVENTATLAQTLKGAGVEVLSVEAELSNREAIDTMIDGLPQIDVLYNNAAIQAGFFQDPWTAPDDAYLRAFQVNSVALFHVCRRLVPGMIERGFGRVINVTSGVRDQPPLAPYAVSKAAVDKYTKDFANSLEGTGVQMNLLDPGWLRTDMGGPQAPGDVTSVLPGALVPALMDDGVSGRWFSAQDYVGMSLQEAVDEGFGS